MANHVKQGIAWVKEHADEYQIDPDRLGLCGASAGGHLASLVAVTADDKSAVKAAGVFFPPTELPDFRGIKIDADTPPEQLSDWSSGWSIRNGNAPGEPSEADRRADGHQPGAVGSPTRRRRF